VEFWYVGCCREEEEGKMKLEESRAYLALGWKAGIAGANKPISSAQLDSQEKPHKAYKER